MNISYRLTRYCRNRAEPVRAAFSRFCNETSRSSTRKHTKQITTLVSFNRISPDFRQIIEFAGKNIQETLKTNIWIKVRPRRDPSPYIGIEKWRPGSDGPVAFTGPMQRFEVVADDLLFTVRLRSFGHHSLRRYSFILASH